MQTVNKSYHTWHESPTFLVEGMSVVEGHVAGKTASVLRDSGSNAAIVRRALVSDDCFSGNISQGLLLDGSVKALQEAVIRVDAPYFSGGITAATMAKPIYDLILGHLPGVRGHQNRYPS